MCCGDKPDFLRFYDKRMIDEKFRVISEPTDFTVFLILLGITRQNIPSSLFPYHGHKRTSVTRYNKQIIDNPLIDQNYDSMTVFDHDCATNFRVCEGTALRSPSMH